MRRILSPNRIYANSVATVDSSIHLSRNGSSSSLASPPHPQPTFKRRSQKSGNAVTKGLKALFGRSSKAKKTCKDQLPLLPIVGGSTSLQATRPEHRRRPSAYNRPASPLARPPSPRQRASRSKSKSKKPQGPSKRKLQQMRWEELSTRARRGEVLDAAEDWELKDLTLKLIGGI